MLFCATVDSESDAKDDSDVDVDAVVVVPFPVSSSFSAIPCCSVVTVVVKVHRCR